MRWLTPLMVVIALLAVVATARAGDEACDSHDCAPTTVINQWSCSECDLVPKCSESLKDCPSGDDDCDTYEGSCVSMCKVGSVSACAVVKGTLPCNSTGLGHCAWYDYLQSCKVAQDGGGCDYLSDTTKTSRGCCVGGTAPTPTPTADPTGTPAYSCSVTISGASGVALGSTETLTATVSMTDSTATGITMILDPDGGSWSPTSNLPNIDILNTLD